MHKIEKLRVQFWFFFYLGISKFIVYYVPTSSTNVRTIQVEGVMCY